MTMTFGPPVDWTTLVLTSGVPSAQVVSVTVPAVEFMVIVPAALQFHVGDVLKFRAHWVASTLTDGGSSMLVQFTHIAPMQWAVLAQP
jgi:hypothetical protein